MKLRVYCTVLLLSLIGFGVAEAQPSGSPAVERPCRICHADKFESAAQSPHSVLDTAAWQETHGEGLGCLSCHGDVAEHIGAGGRAPAFAFNDESARRQNDICLGCHNDSHPQFNSSPHARAGITCTDCHSQHSAMRSGRSLLREPSLQRTDIGETSALCADCHAANLAEFDLNESHRLETVECTSCHDPHAPASRSMLGGFKQQACASCHLDKEGPFVFEHAASRVEGCTACHTPHGSPNRHLLTHQRVGELCYACHAVVPQFHFGFSPVAPPRFDLDTQCTNCHATIHGSNLSEMFLQ